MAYGSDIDEVRRILFDIASRIDHLVENNEQTTPEVHLSGSIELDLLQDNKPMYSRGEDEANTLIYKEFKGRHEIPYAK